MPQCVSEMVQVSNLYLQRGAAKILNKALLKFGCKSIKSLPPGTVKARLREQGEFEVAFHQKIRVLLGLTNSAQVLP